MSHALMEAGNKIDKQTHLLPIFGTLEDELNKDNVLMNFIARGSRCFAGGYS